MEKRRTVLALFGSRRVEDGAPSVAEEALPRVVVQLIKNRHHDRGHGLAEQAALVARIERLGDLSLQRRDDHVVNLAGVHFYEIYICH